jgi:hypothetical protein
MSLLAPVVKTNGKSRQLAGVSERPDENPTRLPTDRQALSSLFQQALMLRPHTKESAG